MFVAICVCIIYVLFIVGLNFSVNFFLLFEVMCSCELDIWTLF